MNAPRESVSGTFDSIMAHLDAHEKKTHDMSREKIGQAYDASYRIVCSCGWSGPWRSEMDDYMCTNLQRDENGHRTNIRGL